MMDDRDFVGPHESLGDHEGAERLAGSSTSVANDVSVTRLQAKSARGEYPRIHAGDNRELPGWRYRQVAQIERLGVFPVGSHQLINTRHRPWPAEVEWVN